MRKWVNRVALRLFEHNEKAYHAAVRMMEQYGKAAIAHLTGTGKSYIAFKLIENNPEKVVIWLSPGAYIFKTRRENMKKEALFSLKASDYNNCSTSDVPVDSHIAREMTLGETVVRGILSARNYAKYQMQGDNLRSTGVQNAVCQTYSDALNTDKIFTDLKIDKLRSVFDTKREKSDASDREKSEKTSLPRSDTVATKQRAGQLSRQKIAQPDSIGMDWGNRNDRQWNEGYQEAKRYFDAHGDLNVSAEYVSPNGYNLGNWVKRQRYARLNPEKSGAVLTEERIAKLDEIGMRWEKADSRPRRLELAQESKRKSENLNVSANHKTGEDIGLCS